MQWLQITTLRVRNAQYECRVLSVLLCAYTIAIWRNLRHSFLNNPLFTSSVPPWKYTVTTTITVVVVAKVVRYDYVRCDSRECREYRVIVCLKMIKNRNKINTQNKTMSDWKVGRRIPLTMGSIKKRQVDILYNISPSTFLYTCVSRQNARQLHVGIRSYNTLCFNGWKWQPH